MTTYGFTFEKVEAGKPRVDYVLIATILVLTGVGLGTLFSASYFRATILFSDPYHFVQRQVLWTVLGLVCALVVSRIPLQWVANSVPAVVVVSLVLMMLTFVPGIGVRVYGARRWIYVFGSSFQPSEAAKPAIVMYLAYLLSKKQDQLDDPVNSILPPVIVVGVFAGLIHMQNDFSTAFFVVFVSLAVFFIANVRLRYFIALGTMVIPLGIILLLTREHRVNRLLAFLVPDLDPAGSGYQVIASRAALSNGGFWGSGIGLSTRKFGSLPEAHSDFVFAILGEELGFVGVVLVIAIFLAFAYRGYLIAYRARDTFSSLLAFGLTSSILFQALMNLAVVAGLVPATGVPLPFFSSGGSSMLSTLVMCGLLVNVSRASTIEGGDHG